MNKFFDYLEMDLPDCVIRELLHYIRRFAAAFGSDMPVEGKMGKYAFCASAQRSAAVWQAEASARSDFMNFWRAGVL